MGRRGQIVDTSHSGGRPVYQVWAHLFWANECAWKDGRWEDILEDEELTQAMLRQFPERVLTAVWHQVRRIRAAYNRGACGPLPPPPPEMRSHRYVRVDGRVYRASPRGKPLVRQKKRTGVGDGSKTQGNQEEKGEG